MGLALALIGLCTAGSVYGTGYGSAAGLLSGNDGVPAGFGLASWRPPWRPTGPAYLAAFSRRR